MADEKYVSHTLCSKAYMHIVIISSYLNFLVNGVPPIFLFPFSLCSVEYGWFIGRPLDPPAEIKVPLGYNNREKIKPQYRTKLAQIHIFWAVARSSLGTVARK